MTNTHHSRPLQPVWLYRFESIDPLGGLWYNSQSEWVYEDGIKKINNPVAHDLPMGYDPRYRKDGRNWFSSVPDSRLMQHWFHRENIPELLDNGFVLYRYLATEYVHYEYETCFIKETSLTRELLNPYSLWDAEPEVENATPIQNT